MNIDTSRPWKEVFALIAEAKAEERLKKHEALLLDDFYRHDMERRRTIEKQEKKEKEERAFEQMLAATDAWLNSQPGWTTSIRLRSAR